MKVVWTRNALRDLDAAHDSISEESPTAAARVLKRIDDAVLVVRRHQEIGRTGRVDNTRELVIPGTPFILVYIIRGRTIQVIAFLHGARRWPDSF